MMYKELRLISISRFISVAVFIFLVVLYGRVYVNHEVFGEWDGVMHYFSGIEFLETGVHTGYSSNYWPPFQPVLLAMGNPLFIGKLVSLIAGFLCNV